LSLSVFYFLLIPWSAVKFLACEIHTRFLKPRNDCIREKIEAPFAFVDNVFRALPATFGDNLVDSDLIGLSEAIVVFRVRLGCCLVILEKSCRLIPFLLVVTKEVNPLLHLFCDVSLLFCCVAIIALIESAGVSLELVSGSCTVSHSL